MPTPVITPAGGSFAADAFPPSVTISGNGAPGGNYSALQYNITHSDNSSTGWTNYRGAVAITYGDTVLAQSARSNSAPYPTPSPTTQVYTLITSGTYVGASSAPTGPIFLDRMGWQIPNPGITSNISGNKVVINGTFSSNVSSFGVQWQWQTAAYTPIATNLANFISNPTALGVVVLANSYQAGTPLNNISPNPISGGSGGGSSNYTGGHSGTPGNVTH